MDRPTVGSYKEAFSARRSLLAINLFLVEGECDVPVEGLWFVIWGLGFGVWGLGFGVWGLGFGVWGLGFGVWGAGSWFTIYGLGFRVRV